MGEIYFFLKKFDFSPEKFWGPEKKFDQIFFHPKKIAQNYLKFYFRQKKFAKKIGLKIIVVIDALMPFQQPEFFFKNS